MINILLVEDDEVDVMNVRRALPKINLTNALDVASNKIEMSLMRQSSDGELPQVGCEA